MHLFSNNSTATIAGAISDNDTTIDVATGHGARFPVIASPDFAYATIEDVSGVWEIVKITTHSGTSDTFTVTRAQEDSTAVGFADGSRFEIRMTAGSIEQFIQREDDVIDGGTY
jgi:hypothetical protein